MLCSCLDLIAVVLSTFTYNDTFAALAYAVVSCAIIARNALQFLHAIIVFLHAIIACFQTCWKIFMRQTCCSQWQRLVESRDVVLVLPLDEETHP